MNLTVYHGSNSIFSKFDQGKARIMNDFYGGGVAYFTDSVSVAKSYARTMSKKSGQPIVYQVKLSLRKLFDVDSNFTGKELLKFYDDSTVENFARGAGLIKLGSDKYTIIGKLKVGDFNLTGDQVFKGLSRGMVNTAKTRDKLIELGYDGLRYNGGRNMDMAVQHNVYLAYRAGSIKIENAYKIVPKTKMEHVSIIKKVVSESYYSYK